MVIRQVESDADRAAVQALLREAFEVQPGVGGAFAQLYLDVITKTSATSFDLAESPKAATAHRGAPSPLSPRV